jgi:hypothetical protein
MITVTVTSDQLKKRAEKVMNHEIMNNPNLNGAEFEVIFGDFDSIDGIDEYVGASLWNEIFDFQEADENDKDIIE